MSLVGELYRLPFRSAQPTHFTFPFFVGFTFHNTDRQREHRVGFRCHEAHTQSHRLHMIMYFVFLVSSASMLCTLTQCATSVNMLATEEMKMAKIFVVTGYNGILKSFGPVGAATTREGAREIVKENEYMLDDHIISEIELKEVAANG